MDRALGTLLTFLHLIVLPVGIASCSGATEPPAPKATTLVLVAAPSAAAETMVPLSTQPVVQAADASGKAVPTATTVTAEVISGHGAVMAGGSTSTDAGGRAVFSGLTLGAVWGQVGTVVLRFTSPGLEPIEREVELRCSGVLPLTIGQTVNGTLTSGDCTFGDTAVRNPFFRNIFEISTSLPVTAVQVTSNLTVVLKGPNEFDHYSGWVNYFGDRVSIKALLSPGTNRLAVTATVIGDPLGSGGSIRMGPYSLTVAAASEDLTCDPLDAFVTTPLTTSQQLGAGDCVSDSDLEDRVVVGLPANATLSVSMTTNAFQPRIRLVDENADQLVAEATSAGSASLAFTNGSTTKTYRLRLSSQTSGGSGPYTLTVHIAYAPSTLGNDQIAWRLK